MTEFPYNQYMYIENTKKYLPVKKKTSTICPFSRLLKSKTSIKTKLWTKLYFYTDFHQR